MVYVLTKNWTKGTREILTKTTRDMTIEERAIQFIKSKYVIFTRKPHNKLKTCILYETELINLLKEFASQLASHKEDVAFKAGIKAAMSEDFMFSTDKELFEQYQTLNPLI